MFNWIKNLTKGAAAGSSVSKNEVQSRVVKRIVPASQRHALEAEAEAEAAQKALLQAEAEKRVAAPAPAPVPEPTATPEPAPAPRPQPSISLPIARIERVEKVEKAERAEPAEPAEPPAPAPTPVPTPARPVVRLSPAREEAPPAPVEAPPPMVRLTSAKKKPALNFSAVPAASSNREIILTVSDFLGRIPAHFVDEKAVPGSQEVRFDASDLYSDMAKGRATVPLSVIAENLPALFKRKLSPEEDIEIQLPLPKIVAQMSDLFTRTDQEAPEAFEEVETPFLKAAQRDQEIHKVSGAVQLPTPVRPPAPAPAPVPVSKPAIPIPEEAPARLPARPKSIGLKLTAMPEETVAEASEAPEPAIEAPTPVVKARPAIIERRVTVRVRPLIQALPIQQRDAILSNIPEDTQVDLPLDEIENQLSSGRVSLSAETFSSALSPSVRKLFNDNYSSPEVPISLSEVVKNLPRQAFQLRDDQHEQEVDPNEFETPFNTTSDAINKPVAPSPVVAAAPAAVPVRSPAPSTGSRAKPVITPAIASYTTRKLNSTSSKYPSPMHAALATQDALDAKKVVKLASALPGVASLTIITDDGLSLAGNLPSFMDPEGFSAMAPQLHRKMAANANEMKLGELKHLSLSTDTHTVTIFTGRGMTIAVLHQNQSDLGHGVREKFIAIVEGLAKQYSPELAAN